MIHLPCFEAILITYIVQLFPSYKSLSFILLGFGALVIALSTFHKCYYLPPSGPSSLLQCCTSQRHTLCAAMFLCFCPYGLCWLLHLLHLLWPCHVHCLLLPLSPFYFNIGTLPFVVPLSLASKTLYLHCYLLSSYASTAFSTSHHSACQYCCDYNFVYTLFPAHILHNMDIIIGLVLCTPQSRFATLRWEYLIFLDNYSLLSIPTVFIVTLGIC